VTSQKQKQHHNNHVPVLLEEVLELLEPQVGEKYLDLTAGYGGHVKEILEVTKNVSGMILVDRDQNAIDSLASFEKAGARLIHSDFASAADKLRDENERFDMILLDLGVSSPQLDNATRGFSFQKEAKLDMRMDESQSLTAETIVNEYRYEDLAFILRNFGEVKRPGQVARAIVDARPIATTLELAEVIEKNSPSRGKIHPATRTFQAIRIAVNQELSQVSTVLPILPDLLNDNGRLVIISFHSLEDRLVKKYFQEEKENGYEARLRILTRKPISGSNNDVHNPRARSAKLRAAVKINTKKQKGAYEFYAN